MIDSVKNYREGRKNLILELEESSRLSSSTLPFVLSASQSSSQGLTLPMNPNLCPTSTLDVSLRLK